MPAEAVTAENATFPTLTVLAERVRAGEPADAVVDSMTPEIRAAVDTEMEHLMATMKQVAEYVGQVLRQVFDNLGRAFAQIDLSQIDWSRMAHPDEGEGMLLSELLSPATLEWIEKEKRR